MSHVIGNFLSSTGFAALTWQEVVMLVISVVLIYLAIAKGFEPLLLLPIGFGMLLTNLPLAGLMEAGIDKLTIIDSNKASGAISVVNELQQPGGLLGYFFKGDELSP